MRLLGLLVGVLVMTLGSGASWADGSIKDAPVAARCGGPFSGAYVGGQVGYIAQDTKFHDELGSGYVKGDDNGVTFGIVSGYNIQCGRWVFGYESDFNYSNTDAKWTDNCCQTVSSEMNWFGTTRGRLGVVHHNDWLFFATAGLAYGSFSNKFVVGSPFDFSQKNTDTRYGWTVGGGVELMRDARWSLKAEALYVDLGKEKIDYVDGCGISCTARIGYENQFWVARVGLNYHFGAREEVVRPMK